MQRVSGGLGDLVVRRGSGDVTAPCAEPLCCRLVRDALSDLVRPGVAGMGPNPVGRLRVRVSEEPPRPCPPATAPQSSRDRAAGRVTPSPRAAPPLAAGVRPPPPGPSPTPRP